jgi:hypothetical protein
MSNPGGNPVYHLLIIGGYLSWLVVPGTILAAWLTIPERGSGRREKERYLARHSRA